MEDKRKICELLLATLQATRNHGDMTALTYDEVEETVTICWASGGKLVVNVSMDSGTAMIRDIMRAINLLGSNKMTRPHEQLDGLSLKAITDELINEITEEYGVSKATARRLLATALNRRLVSNEVMGMVHFLMTGWEKD